MAKNVVYFDDSNNYVSYSVFEILVNKIMSFKDLHNILRSKLDRYIDMNNIDIPLPKPNRMS